MDAKRLLVLLAIIGAVLAIVFRDSFDWSDGGGDDGGGEEEVVNVFPEPSSEALKQLVQPVRDAVRGQKNLLGLAWFYFRMSAVQRDRPVTTEQARMLHKTAGDELARIAGGVAYRPEMHAVVEKIFQDYIGLETKRLTQADRDKISEMFAAIAWAVFQESDNKVTVLALPDQTQLVCTEAGCWIDAPKDYAGNKLPDYLVNGLIEQEDDEAIRVNMDTFAYPMVMPSTQEDDPPVTVNGQEYPTGLMFDPDELKQWNETGLMMAEIPLTSGKGETRLLYNATLQFDPQAYAQERQTTGDCTSHAFRNACDTSRAFEIIVQCDPEAFICRGATEAIYGYRGHNGQGMSPFRAAQFVSQQGGVMLRQKYGDVDASTYNAELGIRWGGRGGPPNELVSLLKNNQMQRAALVNNVDEARDAIFNGYALAVGSDVGFDSTRDQYGFAKRKGSWMHCMAWVAVSTAYALAGDDWQKYGTEKDSPCFLVVNSWGEWNGGSEGVFDIPTGAFWITSHDAAAMIGQKMSFAVGSFNGFAARPLVDWGFSYLTLDTSRATAGDPELNGVVEQAAGVVVALYVEDPTKPDGSKNDGDDSDDAVTPDKCSRCNGTGYIQQGDGHRSSCPGDKGNGNICPFKTSSFNQKTLSLAA